MITPKVKKRRIVAYSFRETKQKSTQVLDMYYGIDFSKLASSQEQNDLDIKTARKIGAFPQGAKARKFRIVIEELE
jgi:hypothetical protein